MDPRDLKKDDLDREVRNLRQRIIKLEESSLQKDHIIQKYSLLANIIAHISHLPTPPKGYLSVRGIGFSRHPGVGLFP
jgi:hypothetical protein